ncbi:MAG TPA: hypothetical protein VMX16_11880 [Terriglobia bacterium]|nr:hypothetical protein [Terriglobia bacterium]
MDQTLQFLLQHGSAVLLICVFVDQLGLLFPAVPLLIGVGALAGRGQFPLPLGVGEAGEPSSSPQTSLPGPAGH